MKTSMLCKGKRLKVRKIWRIKPITKIKESGKLYKRIGKGILKKVVKDEG